MEWKKIKTWKKGLIIGLIPLILTIVLTIVFFIMFSGGAIFLPLILGLHILYPFSIIFLVSSVLTGFVIHKNWKIKIAVFLVIILLFSSTFVYLFSGQPPSGEVETYKGIWTPFHLATAEALLFDIQQLKEDGVNTLSFGPFYFTDDKGNIHTIPFMREITIFLIQTAHRNGFKVFLVPDMWGPGFTGIENNSLFLEQATPKVLEWADIAEKYGVEMFAPSNEPAIIIEDKEALNQWAHDVAVKIKARYHGILVYKASGADWGFDNDYRGYDYVGLDIFPYDDMTLEEFRDELKENIADGLEYVQRDNCRGVIFSEIGVQVKAGMKGDITTAEEFFSLDYQKQAYEIFFEEGEANNITGYIFCCWGEGQYGPDDVPAEEVMKEWFHKIK